MGNNWKEKGLSGYPSIDKPWYNGNLYRDTPIREINAEQTIYELVFNSNQDNMESAAIGYFNVKMTFRKLKELADKTASAFSNYGLKMGDVVLIGVSNCPEMAALLLALNKIGVISRWFDLRAGEKDIESYAKDSKCKCLVVFDFLIPLVDKIIKNTDIQKVIVIRPTDSLPLVVQAANATKSQMEGTYVKIPKNGNYISFKDFVNDNAGNTDVECVSFDKNRPSVMIQSSGTTGKPKVIVHSDYTVAYMVKQIANSDLPFGENQIVLSVLPPWIAYGLGDALILPLTLGTKVELCPMFNPESVYNYLGKFTFAFAVPLHYRYIRDNYNLLSKSQKEGIKMIKCLISGGDKISSDENKELEELFNARLLNGYGNNEACGAITANTVKKNLYGSVGIPKYGDIVAAFDTETGKECKYNEIGEICVLTETMFLKYDKNEEETNQVKQLHEDGNVWIHTGDLGFVDEDGFVTLCGRARRVIIRGGYKISAYTIEDKICEAPYVKECVAVEVEDKDDEHAPMVFVTLHDNVEFDNEKAKTAIIEKCKSELKSYEVPKHIVILDKLPYTQNGKYNFRALELRGNEYVQNNII